MVATSVVRSPLSAAATRMRLGKRLARAGLTEQERAVLGLRLQGMSHRQVGAAVRLSGARAEQLERQAVAKLARVAGRRLAGVTVAAVFRARRAELALDAEEGRPVLVTTGEELHGDRRDRPRARKRVAVPPDERRLEALATALLADAEAGRLSDKRRGWYADQAGRLASAG